MTGDWLVTPRNRRILITSCLLLLLLSFGGLKKLQFDHSPQALLGTTAARVPVLEVSRIVLCGPLLFTQRGLEAIEDLEARLAALPEVRQSFSAIQRHRLDLEVTQDMRHFWSELARSEGLDRQLGLVSRSGDAISILLETQPRSEREAQAFFNRLLALLEALPKGLSAELVSERSLDLAFRASSLRMWKRAIPLLGASSLLLLAWTFGSFRAAAAPLLYVATGLLPILGALGASDTRLHLLLNVLPPFLLATALATALHLGVATREILARRATGQEAAAVLALRSRARALFGAHATTALGFLALAASPARPVRELALWSASGIAWQALLTFTLLPSLLASSRWFPSSPIPSEVVPVLGYRCMLLARAAARHSRVVLGVATVSAVVAAWGWRNLQIDSNALNYLSRSHSLRERIDRLEREGFPIWRTELELTLGEGQSFRDPKALEALFELTAEIQTSWPAQTAVGLPTLLEEFVKRLGDAPPTKAQEWATVLPAFELTFPEIAARYLDSSGSVARLVVFFPTVAAETLETWKEVLSSRVAQTLPGSHLVLRGLLAELLELQRQVLSTFLRSGLFALLPIGTILFSLIRPLPLAGIAILVNLWPAGVLLGGFSLLGGKLDVGTVLALAILLGLIVDATFHLLALAQKHTQGASARAISLAARRVGPALLLSTAILSFGFASTAGSDFLPLARLGILLVTGLILSLASDLILLPAMLARRDRVRKRRQQQVGSR